nr:hypothetical protein [uncultured Dongia sp.]
MFETTAFNRVHANVNASNVVDISAIRARLATGQPMFDKPTADQSAASLPHIGVGDWVRTATNIVGFVKRTYVDDKGVPRAVITNGSGIEQSHAIRTLTLSERAGFHQPAPVAIQEGC